MIASAILGTPRVVAVVGMSPRSISGSLFSPKPPNCPTDLSSKLRKADLGPGLRKADLDLPF